MRGLSISLKLAAWYAFSLLLGMAVFGLVMRLVLATSMLSWKDRTLQMRSGRVEAALSESITAGRPLTQHAVDRRLSDLAGILPEGEWIQIARGDGTRVFPHGPIPASMPVLPFTPCPLPILRDLLAGRREHFRLLCHPVTYAGQPAFLLVPSPLAEDQILLRTFTVGLYRLVPMVLAISVVGGYALSRRALRPVDQLIAEAHSVTATDLSRRLTVPAADDQMRRLAIAWNDLLARIETAMIQVTQFTADASHELRSPIACIRIAAEVSLGNPALDEESRGSFRTIADEAALTGELLENLLLLAHPDARPFPAEIEAVDVAAAAEDLIRHFGPATQRKHQTVHLISTEPAPALLINPLHLRRVLTAVFDNAVKYTPDGGFISISYTFADGFALQVADNGMGIAQQHLHRVFDRFFQIDPARSGGSEGVGLGLPIARWLMKRYGGDVTIASESGRGTTVKLAFPQCMVVASPPLESFHGRL